MLGEISKPILPDARRPESAPTCKKQGLLNNEIPRLSVVQGCLAAASSLRLPFLTPSQGY
jgi:hypothetical protein